MKNLLTLFGLLFCFVTFGQSKSIKIEVPVRYENNDYIVTYRVDTSREDKATQLCPATVTIYKDGQLYYSELKTFYSIHRRNTKSWMHDIELVQNAITLKKSN